MGVIRKSRFLYICPMGVIRKSRLLYICPMGVIRKSIKVFDLHIQCVVLKPVSTQLCVIIDLHNYALEG